MALILEGSQPLLPAAAASLPTASAAGELPVSDGAGSAYTATTAGDVLALGMVAALTGEPAGAALISDGAGGVTETSADVSAMLAAADAAAARAALGVTAASHTTGTFAAARALTPAVGDTFVLTDVGGSLRCDVAGTWVWSHGGPLAASRGPFSGAGAWIAARGAAATAGPVGGPGYSFALGLHVVALPGATEKVLLAHDNGAVGFFLGCADVTDNRIYLCQRGIPAGAGNKIELTDAVGSAHADLATGSYVIAVSIAPTAVRWSINGGAVGSLVISGTYAPPAATSRFVLMNFTSSDLAPNAEVAFFQAFHSTLSDAALQALGAGHATYLPGNASAVPVASYLAGSHPRYDVSGQLVGTEGAALVVEPSTAGWTAR